MCNTHARTHARTHQITDRNLQLLYLLIYALARAHTRARAGPGVGACYRWLLTRGARGFLYPPRVCQVSSTSWLTELADCVCTSHHNIRVNCDSWLQQGNTYRTLMFNIFLILRWHCIPHSLSCCFCLITGTLTSTGGNSRTVSSGAL
jgi:hypothetical protein